MSHPSLEAVKNNPVNRVKVAVCDNDGILRGKYMQKEKFLKSVEEGFGFCSVLFGWDCHDEAYPNSPISGFHNGYPDTTATIDLDTFREIPWENNTPFFLAHFEKDGEKPSQVCPRNLLKNTLEKAKDQGYKASFGLEFEWYNFSETPESLAKNGFNNPKSLTPGMCGYSLTRPTQNQEYFQALMDDLSAFDIPLEGIHTETGPGVFEAAILYSDAMKAADRAVLFKSSVKEIACQFGIMPTFMARWHDKLPGSSGHMHQSLWSVEDKTSIFYDASDPNFMSAKFKSYVAGQVKLLPELLVLFAPTINSYKRLVEGFWAPTRSTWGVDNRTAAMRVIKGSESSTRLETRVSGADINPYLAVTAALAAGLYGMENDLVLDQAPVAGNAYLDKDAKPLSKNLLEATLRFERSDIARELFGDTFVEFFVSTRKWEWEKFEQTVTTYERERYFEII